jgi:hypothetical protein
VSGDEVTAKYETFVIPASDGQIHHIRVLFHPFLHRS